jgi:carbonic anhydrase
VLFNVSKTQEENPMLNFLTNPQEKVDLSQLFTTDFALTNTMYGYVGTNSVPNCERNLCWYVLDTIQTIGPKQYEQIKVDGIGSNNRYVHNHTDNLKPYIAKALFEKDGTPTEEGRSFTSMWGEEL